VTDYASAKRADTARYGRFFHAMLDRGVFLAPSQVRGRVRAAGPLEQDLQTAAQACCEAMRIV
jgi:glutamate-1-semialdehyde 2,1-aminomutase